MSSVARLLVPVRWLLRSSMLRLTLMLSALFAVGMAVAIFVALFFGRTALIERVDTNLASLAANVTISEVKNEDSITIIRALNSISDLPKPFERAANRGGGSIVLGKDYKGFDAWRVMITQDSEATPILVALPIEDSEDALDLLGGILWTTALTVVAVSLLIGLIVGAIAQRRLRRINKTLSELASGNLKSRSGITGKSDDLDDLGRRLDHTAFELERLVAQTRHLSASIAHDLRTPLARLRAQLEMLPEGDERGAALEEAARLSQIFDTIMRVAKIEAGQGKDSFEEIRLGELLSELEEIFGPVVEDGGKKLILNQSSPGSIHADRQMVVQVMANLIQNAIVHGGDEIRMIANGSIIGVADNGDGVHPSHHEEILQPMVRLDAARETVGTGLGLALVRAVADRHNAELELSQAEPHGLKVTLNFTKL